MNDARRAGVRAGRRALVAACLATAVAPTAAAAQSSVTQQRVTEVSSHVEAGTFERIYDPSVGEDGPWYINDHAFIPEPGGGWHLFGITHAEPANPLDEDNFAHATARELTRSPWQKEPFALSVDESQGEVHLWAPHVVRHRGSYYKSMPRAIRTTRATRCTSRRRRT